MNKKILKGVGVLALAGIFAFPAMNVKAADACEGKTKHTNYYMFLDVNDTSVFDNLSDAGVTYYTSAYKYNNIPVGSTISENGMVNIYRTSPYTSSKSSIQWTLAEYWTNNAALQANADENHMYKKSDTEAFFGHTDWWKYTDSSALNSGDSAGTKMSATNDFKTSGVTNTQYVNGSITLEPSIKVVVTPPTEYKSTTVTSTSTSLRWTVMRNYIPSELTGLTGIPYTNANNANAKMYYQPAAYYVIYCGDEKEATTTKTWKLNYDANGSGATVPDSTTADCGTAQSVSNIGSSIAGKTFAGWALSANSTDVVYKAGAQITSSTTSCSDVTLYAVFTDNTTANAKTGKFLNILGFSSIGIAAAVGYLYTKRKNLFKKIR